MNQAQSSLLSPAARRVARTILNGFESYFAEYQNITLGAKRRFETANWLGVHQASTERIDLYKSKVGHVVRLVREVTSQDLSNLELWHEARSAYAQLVSTHANYEIAETFFNGKLYPIRAEIEVGLEVLGEAEARDNTRVKSSLEFTGANRRKMARLYLDTTADQGTSINLPQ